jgi:hypothetical protein
MTTTNLDEARKPISAAYNDALVALGLRAPQQAPPATAPRPLAERRTSPLRITVDLSTQAGRVWQSRYGEFGVSRSFDSVELEQGVVENARATYATVSPLGRPEAILSRTGNSNRTVQLVVELRHTGETTLDQAVVIPARWLKSFEYPISIPATGSGVLKDTSKLPSFKSYNPPPVIVQLGGIISMRALLLCDIKWGGPWSYEGETSGRNGAAGLPSLMPHSASVVVTLTQVTKFTEDPDSYNYSLTPWGLGNRP